MKTIPLAIALYLVSLAAHAQVDIGSGGDDLRQLYKKAAKRMAEKTAHLRSCSLGAGMDSEARRWLLENHRALAEDIRTSPHRWVDEKRPTCAFTQRSKSAEVRFSFPTCRETSAGIYAAQRTVVHESVHHFGFDDEDFADEVADLVVQAVERRLCPEDRPDPDDLILDTALDNACVLHEKKVICWGRDAERIQATMPRFTDPRHMFLYNRSICVLDGEELRCSDAHDTPPDHHGVQWADGTYGGGCFLDDFGIKCWGQTLRRLTLPELDGVRQVAVGNSKALVLDAQGLWSARAAYRYHKVAGAVNPTLIDLFEDFRVVFDDQGLRYSGEDYTDLRRKESVPHIEMPSMIAAGSNHGCAIDQGQIRCFGDNSFGQAPKVVLAQNPVAISAGKYYSCAIDDRGVFCWGDQRKAVVREVPPTLRR